MLSGQALAVLCGTPPVSRFLAVFPAVGLVEQKEENDETKEMKLRKNVLQRLVVGK